MIRPFFLFVCGWAFVFGQRPQTPEEAFQWVYATSFSVDIAVLAGIERKLMTAAVNTVTCIGRYLGTTESAESNALVLLSNNRVPERFIMCSDRFQNEFADLMMEYGSMGHPVQQIVNFSESLPYPPLKALVLVAAGKQLERDLTRLRALQNICAVELDPCEDVAKLAQGGTESSIFLYNLILFFVFVCMFQDYSVGVLGFDFFNPLIQKYKCKQSLIRFLPCCPSLWVGIALDDYFLQTRRVCKKR
jgi:hypothetical protein